MKESDTVMAAFVGHGVVELRRVPRPEMETGSVMVLMKASGICGTDLEKLSGGYIASSILGHEVSGIVSSSRSPLFEEGDDVVPHHHVACGECYFCRSGAETMCDGFRNSNFVPCGFANEFKVPEYNVKHGGLHKVEGLSHEEASFAEPLGCCIRGLNNATNGIFSAIRNVLVIGSGPIGLLHMEIIRGRSPNTNLVAADISATRLQFAEKNENAATLDVRQCRDWLFSNDALKLINTPGYDLVVVATANASAFAEAVKCVRKSGTLLLFGAPHMGSTYTMELQSLLLRELTITSSYATTEREIDEAINMLKEGRIKVKKFITSTYPLEKIADAIDAARAESQVKVLVVE